MVMMPKGKGGKREVSDLQLHRHIGERKRDKKGYMWNLQ